MTHAQQDNSRTAFVYFTDVGDKAHSIQWSGVVY